MTLTEYSHIIVDPKDLGEKARQLSSWWKSGPQGIKSLNHGVEQQKDQNVKSDSIRLLSEMNEQFNSEASPHKSLQQNGGNFFNISAYVSFIKNDDRVYYLACPEENCRRKVIENDGNQGPGRYRCEHCNRSFDHCEPTYMLMGKIADLSDSVFVNFYR